MIQYNLSFEYTIVPIIGNIHFTHRLINSVSTHVTDNIIFVRQVNYFDDRERIKVELF